MFDMYGEARNPAALSAINAAILIKLTAAVSALTPEPKFKASTA